MEEFEQQEIHNEAPQEINQPQQEEYINAPQNNGIDWGGDIKRFFTEDLKDMLLAIIKRPATGAQQWLDNTQSKSIVNPICMILSSFVLITLMAFIILHIKLGNAVGFGTSLAIGTTPIFFSLFISLFMFIFMAIKQKPDIIMAFRQSSLHVLILTMAMIALLVTFLIFVNTDKSTLIGLAFGKIPSGYGFAALIMMLISVYAISMGFSAARQTLKACQSNDKECYSWYIAPLVVFLPIYLSYIIVSAML